MKGDCLAGQKEPVMASSWVWKMGIYLDEMTVIHLAVMKAYRLVLLMAICWVMCLVVMMEIYSAAKKAQR
eukprot:13614976-Ditylum_brightwellii.AAC.2